MLRCCSVSPHRAQPCTNVSSGNALTDNFLVDVGISQYQFNVGQQLLSLGIVLLEVNHSLPSTPIGLVFLGPV